MQTCGVPHPGLQGLEWQSCDRQPCVSHSKVIFVTRHCPFGPVLLKNGSAVETKKKKKRILQSGPWREARGMLMDLPFVFLSACPQPVPFVTVAVGLKGCELFHVNDLHPQLAHRTSRSGSITPPMKLLFPEKRKMRFCH